MAPVFSQPVVCPVLVGREEALASLRSLREQALGRGVAVLVSGEAGIGKSRLLAEFTDESLQSGWRAFHGRFFEQDGSLPYSAIGRLLDDGLAAGNRDLRGLIEPYAADLAPLSAEVARIAPSAAPAVEPDPGRDRRRITDALVRLVRAAAAAQPALLVFEDLHWADESSLDALLQLARDAVPGCLVLLTYRDDESSPDLDSFLAQLDRERLSAELRLQRLRLQEVDEMLRAVLGAGRSTRADFLHTIFQLTGGNPFFVEEVLRSFLDQAGSPERLDALALADIDVPRGVNEAVRRRTRLLTPAARQVLSLAAVAGVRFDFPLLKELSGRSEEEMLLLMKELIGAQLVVEEMEDQFHFRHALTREAIRSELLQRERRQLSLQIAEAIERMHANDLENRAEDLAWHFHEAGEWAKAFQYSLQAGRRALALYAPAAALGHLNRALEAGARLTGAGLAEAFRLRGTAHEAVGDFEAARADYERAAADAEALGDRTTHWRALLDLGLLWASRDYAKSEPYYTQALELAREMGDAAAIGLSLDRLGNWYANTGDFERARSLNEEALEILRATGDRRGVAQTLDLLGMTCYMEMQIAAGAAYYREAIPLLDELGDRLTLTSALASIPIGSGTYQTDVAPPEMALREGSDFGEKALVIARQTGSRSAESYALWQLSFALGPQGEYERALSCAREALAIANEIGHTQWETAAECALGAVLTDILALDEAKPHLDRALALSNEMNSKLWMEQAASLLIDNLVAGRDLPAAVRVSESQTLGSARPFGARQLYVSCAELLLARGETQRALEMLETLEAEAARSVPGKVSVRLGRLRARLLAAAGDAKAAVAILETARELAQSNGNLSSAWRLDSDLARIQFEAGDREAARRPANDALQLMDSLAARIGDAALASQFASRAAEQLPAPLRRRLTREHVEALTGREAEVAGLVARGFTNREIAERLVLSSRTVETHVANAMAKLGFSTRSQLAAWAVEHGISATDT